MASGSHETPLQLRIIPCHVGSKSFGVHLELEDLGFHLELEDLGFQSELEVFSNFWKLSCGTWLSYLVSGYCVCLSRNTQLTKSPKPGDDLARSDPQIRLITWEGEKPSTS